MSHALGKITLREISPTERESDPDASSRRTREAPAMRMYELWKLPERGGEPVRLEDAGGPVLFHRICDAEAQSREDPDRWAANYAVVLIRVGRA
jgi:hypothetical protein